MIKTIFFNLVRLFMVFKPNNMTVLRQIEYSDGTRAWDYSFGSTIYRSVGVEPSEPQMGMFFPVLQALCEGDDITSKFKRYAGPKCNHVPDTGYILSTLTPYIRLGTVRGKLRLQLGLAKKKGQSKDIVVTNILGQVSVFGAK